MIKERMLLWNFCFSGAFGLFILLSMLNRPSVANMRTVDVVTLIASGMCLGTALTALGLFFVVRDHRPHDVARFGRAIATNALYPR
jgi:hypothetical protein